MPESRYAVWRTESETSVTDQYPYDSIRYKSFNNVIETLLCVAYKHKFIEQVGSGDIYEVDLEKFTAFPYFFAIPKNIVTDDNSLTFNFQLLVMDLVEPGLNNEQQVLSDTAQILMDIIAIFRNGEITKDSKGTREIYYTDAQFSLEPFTERFDANVSGWSTEFSIKIDDMFSACNVPLKDENNCVQ